MRTSSAEEVMKCLEQGTHALVGVRQDMDILFLPDICTVTMPKVAQTSDEDASKAGGDSPLVLWTRRTSTTDLSDPFLDAEDIGCGVLGNYEDEYFVPNAFHLPEPTLREGVGASDEEPVIELPTTVSVDLFDMDYENKEQQPVVKIPGGLYYERLAPLVSYNDNALVKLDRPENPVTAMILRHKMRSGCSYKLRLPRMEMKHRVKNGEIKESILYHLPWNVQARNKLIQQQQTSQTPQFGRSDLDPKAPEARVGGSLASPVCPLPNSGTSGSAGIGASTKTPRVTRARPPLTPISIPRINVQDSPSPNTDPSPVTPGFPHCTIPSGTVNGLGCYLPTPPPTSLYPTPPQTATSSCFPSPRATWDSFSLPMGTQCASVGRGDPVSPSPFNSNSNLGASGREYKLMMRPAEYTVLRPNRSDAHELKLPPSPMSPTAIPISCPANSVSPTLVQRVTNSLKALDSNSLPRSLDTFPAQLPTPSPTPTRPNQLEVLSRRLSLSLSPSAKTFVPYRGLTQTGGFNLAPGSPTLGFQRVSRGNSRVPGPVGGQDIHDVFDGQGKVLRPEPVFELAPPWPPFVRRNA